MQSLLFLRRTAIPTLVCALLATAPSPSVFADAPRTDITVQLGERGRPISPHLFGIFFEDLNYAADGGLYAELVQNRSFEYNATEQTSWNALSSWEVEKRGGEGDVRIKTAAPIHPHNPHYAVVAVRRPGAGVGLSNAGFGGIPVSAGDGYDVSFFAHQLYMGEPWGPDNRIEGRPMPVTIRLEATNGDVLAESSTQVVGRSWRKYAARVTPSRTEEKARVVLLAHAQGGIAVDEVSVFPGRTFRDRPNGLRADLAQAIADLKPKFVRFPGGCLAHGDGIGNFYNWKDTIGPVEQRKGQRNLWGYHQSVGLGYQEYFQFCEDIGAMPLPVVPAGVCCQNADSSPGMGQQGVPMTAMQAYIQDVLDLIEWANGPATSEWGAKRAAAGHPEPFGLKYLGVGNEDKITPVFEERFAMIHRAVKAKHPDIVVIGTAGPFPDGEDFDQGWAVARRLAVPVVDEHYYRPPDWFWENLHRYDAYDRSGPKVYVGEYAAHERNRANTLRSALAEAAAFVSFERNGDVVHFASYAPLLARRDHTQWRPDMIYFTATEVLPSANYYAQQLLGLHGGDHWLETSVPAGAAASRLVVSSVRDSKTGTVILKIVNGADGAAALKITLAGAPAGPHPATRTLLTGSSGAAMNEFGKAPAVRPETTEITLEPVFDYDAPANSLTVLRFAAPGIR